MNRRSFIKKSVLTGGSLSIGASVLAKNTPADPLIIKPLAQAANDTPLSQGIPLRFRQIHLDFHTSEHVPDVAARFDPELFAATLKKASVNSVTVFAKCCHGHFYYPSQRFPDMVHPTLTRPALLKEQIEACHKYGIRTPIYTVIQWDVKQARAHADWLVLDIKGLPTGTPQNEAGFMRNLCVNTPYTDFTKAYFEEVHDLMPVDGWFIDIVMEKPCFCAYCRAGMKKAGLNPLNEADGMTYATQMFQKWKTEMTQLIRKRAPQATIFYNTGHIGPYIRSSITNYTHLELESLPSGGEWGYMHFPTTVRYARTLGNDLMGMTGKFHTDWGDFHSLKNLAALEFECFTMLAQTAKCSVGDQLHPSGLLDEATYNLIGHVYSQVAQKEPWCEEASSCTEIGVLHPETFVRQAGKQNHQAIGTVRMLQELNYQFDLIEPDADFSRYRLLVLPDVVTVDAALKARLETFLAAGGSLLASHESGLTPDKKAFAIPAFGLELVGKAPYSPDYINMRPPLGNGLPQTELVMYMAGLETRPTTAEVLLQVHVPYFNRTPEHFFSHKHAPSTNKAAYPAATRHGRVIYFAHPVFSQYGENAPIWCKRMVANAIEQLLPSPLVRLANAPSATVAALNVQRDKRRYVLHLLCYIPERRGNAFDVIEEAIPIQRIGISLQVPEKIRRAVAVPQGRMLPLRNQDGRLTLELPELHGHQMIEFTY